MGISRRSVVNGIAASTVASFVAYPNMTLSAAKTHKIAISGFKFNPRELEIMKGDTVEWVNQDFTQHTATAKTDEPIKFNTGDISPRSKAKHTIDGENDAGEVNYLCIHHPQRMTGKITIKS